MSKSASKSKVKSKRPVGAERFQGQSRNTRQKVAGLRFIRVGKVETRMRRRVERKIQAGLPTSISAVTEEVMNDLFVRVIEYIPKGKRTVDATTIARALAEEACLAGRITGFRKVGGIYVHPITGNQE